MTDLISGTNPLGDVEALVRSAGNYVQPSEDLRPRVLETARTQHFERRVIRYIAQAAFVLGWSLASASSLNLEAEWPTSIAIDSPQNAAVLRSPAGDEQRPTERSWETVESFRELRTRQARLFNPAL